MEGIEAEIILNSLPGIKPSVVRMTVFRIISLTLEIACIRGSRFAVLGEHFRIAGNEAAFRVVGSARKDVDDEASGNAFRLQFMEGFVGIFLELKRIAVFREIAEGLQHDADDVDLFIFLNVSGSVGSEGFFRFCFVIAFGFFIRDIRCRIDQGIEDAAAAPAVCRIPRFIQDIAVGKFDVRFMDRLVVDGCIRIDIFIQREAEQDQGGSSDRTDPDETPTDLCLHEEEGKYGK